MDTRNIVPRSGMLPPWVSQRIATELQPGESLVWAAQPDPALAVRGTRALSLIGGIMLIPMIIFFGIMTIVIGLIAFFTHNICFGLILLPVLCTLSIIIAAVVGMPFWTRSLARKTIYAVTDRRAIIWQQGLFASSVRSFAPAQLAEIERVERPDGTGDLVFQRRAYYDHDGQYYRQAVGFAGLIKVRQVEALLRATLLAAPNPPA